MRVPWIIAGLGFLLITAVLSGDEPAAAKQARAEFGVFRADEMDWTAGPPSLPKGAQMAVLEGDPSADGPFVFRIKVPDGYRIPPHSHPKTERVTVISGTVHLGMGKEFNKSDALELPAGTFGYWEAGMTHFVWAEGETVVQIHGSGPWSIDYVNPQDDPRKQPKVTRRR